MIGTVGHTAARTVIAGIAIGCGGAQRGSPSERCSFPPYVATRAAQAPPELAPLRPYRNYYALADVSPPAHLYAVWYRDLAPTVVHLRVTEDARGAIHIEQAGGWWGGFGVPPKQRPPSPPAEVARFTRAVVDAVAGCGRAPMIAYRGHHRVMRAFEVIKHGDGVGWYATTDLHVDPELTRVEAVGEQQSAFGLLSPPEGARWVAYRPPPEAIGTTLVLTNRTDELTAALLAAARDVDAGAAGPAIESLEDPDDDSFLPPAFVQHVRAEITVYGRAGDLGEQQGGIYHVPLSVSGAVFDGTSTGRATVVIGGRRFTLEATLTAAPRAPTAARVRADFAGSLGIVVDGGPTRRLRRSYAATGPIDLDGDRVVAPIGFEIPGASSPSPAADRRHARLAGDDQFSAFDVYVGVSLFSDPRDH